MKDLITQRHNDFFIRFGEIAENPSGLYGDLKNFHDQTVIAVLEKVKEEVDRKNHYWHLRWEGIGGEEGEKRKEFNKEVSGYINSVVGDISSLLTSAIAELKK